MFKGNDPKELAIALLSRSQCAVQVACVIADAHGIYAWGWNHSGADGLGMHAEAHALSRMNWKRVEWSTIYVAARRRKSGSIVTAKPCENCESMLKRFLGVRYRDRDGWQKLWGV